MLLNAPVASAALEGLVGWFHAPLDIEKMQMAAQLLVGEHDFSAYRAAECQAKSPVKTMVEAGVERLGRADAAYQLMVVSLRGNAFLQHMVRNIVGELVYVGAGRRSLDEFREILEGRDRRRAAPTFSPDGLYLCDVEYNSRFGLPAVRSGLPFGK
jgi:tRNA pseudouridine38-40 synthase